MTCKQKKWLFCVAEKLVNFLTTDALEIGLQAVLGDFEYKIFRIRDCLGISINEMTARNFT